MSLTWRALGALAAIYPPVAAVVGLLLFSRAGRPRLRGQGLLWAGLGLLTLPICLDAVAGTAGRPALTEALDILLVAVCAIAGSLLARAGGSLRDLSPGMATGLVVVGVLSTAQWIVEGGRASGWTSHANIWGAVVVMPLAMVAAGPASRTAVLASFSAAYAVSITSGSRASLIGVTLVLVGTLGRAALSGTLTAPARSRGRLLVAAVAGAALLAALAGLQPRAWRTAVEALRELPSSGTGERVLGAAQALGVTVEVSDRGTLLLTKTRPEGWSRVQWPMVMFPGTLYATYWEVRHEDPAAVPGVLGVVRGDDTIELSLGETGWTAAAGGRIELVEAAVTDMDGGWTGIALAFRSNADVPLWMWIGPAPDLGGGATAATLEVREVRGVVGGLSELERSSSPTPLSPGTAAALARLSAFRAAWRAFLAEPLFGHRGTSFSDYYRANPPDQNTAVPSHAHNELLQSLFQRGLVGTSGLVLVLVWFARVMRRGGEGFAAWLALVPAIAMNAVDTFLWSARMLGFLVLVASMAVAHRSRQAGRPA